MAEKLLQQLTSYIIDVINIFLKKNLNIKIYDIC